VSHSRTLLWPSSGRVEWTDVPAALEQSLQREFPELRIVVARSEQEFLQELPDCEILVAMKIKPEQFALCRELRWIHSTMAGVTPLLVPGLVSSNVIVTNGRTVHSVPVAEQALAILLALARRMPTCVHLQTEQRWGQDDFWQAGQRPFELQGKTLGLVGLGAIGNELAPRARALGMRVLAVRRNASKGSEIVDQVYPSTALQEMLPEADFVVLLLPDTAENLHIIGAPEFAKMKRSAYLINMARGPLVDTNALLQALESGTIAGAGLDVTDPEPLPSEHPLWKLPNVLITPHLGGASDRFWERESALLRENLQRYLSGSPLLNVVEKQRGY
jgi:phosphoglycerate dehydrogenase-like enzyme